MPTNHREDLLKAVNEIEDVVKEVTSKKIRWFDKIWKLVEAIVPKVEEVGTKAESFNRLKGKEKKEIALGLISDIYFKYIDIKIIPNFIERAIVRRIASTAIDSFVKLMNSRGVFKHFDSIPN